MAMTTMKSEDARTVRSSSPPRKYFLLDASAHLCLLEEATNPSATEKMKLLLERRGSGSAYLYMPNFCIAEVFNGFAKKHFYEELITAADYQIIRENFRKQIRYAEVIQSYELNYYHIIAIDWILQEEHTFNGTKKPLSTYDMLIISMGIELTKIHGRNNFYIITGDRRLKQICKKLHKLAPDERQRRQIPTSAIFPACRCIQDIQIDELRDLFK